MQQHSQIVELKDRLQKSIDDSYNVKDVNEVTRVISVLERIYITREDLEKTRLGKTINELRKKTTDKELAKRAKKLIKTWQTLMVSNGHRNAAYSQPPDDNSPADTHDEDSNSSVFSNLSVDGIALANSRSLLGSPSAPILTNHNSAAKKQQLSNNNSSNLSHNNSSRKRKLESETDTLRENLNSIMISGGRRLQTTQELAQKYNVLIKPSSASSSPQLQFSNKNDTLSPAKRPKVNGTSYHKNGFSHHDENSLHELESLALAKQNYRYHNKSLPASPALQSLRNTTSHSANTSPALQFENDVATRPNLKVSVKLGKSSRNTSPSTAMHSTSASDSLVNGRADESESKADGVKVKIKVESKAKHRETFGRTVSEVDRDIREIYAQLPKVSQEDLEWREHFIFETDEPDAAAAEEEPVPEEQIKTKSEQKETVNAADTVDAAQSLQAKVEVEENDDEYELFEYNEEYEELEDEEVEVTDEEAEEEEDADDVSELEGSSQRLGPRQAEDGVQKQQQQPLHTEANLTESDVSGGSSSSSMGSIPPPPEPLPEHTMGDILQCDKSAASVVDDSCDGGPAAAQPSGEEDVSKQSNGVIEQEEQAEPDSMSINSCDDSSDLAISSSTTDALKRQEADSTTTVDEQQQQQQAILSPGNVDSSGGDGQQATKMSDDECVTSTESPGALHCLPSATTTGTEGLAAANGTTANDSEMPPDCSPDMNSVQEEEEEAATAASPLVLPTSDDETGAAAPATVDADVDPFDLYLLGDDFLADIEMLSESCYTDPSGEFYCQFPPTTPLPEAVVEDLPSPSPSTQQLLAEVKENSDSLAAAAAAAGEQRHHSLAAAAAMKARMLDASSSSSSSDSEDDEDDDDDDSSDDAESDDGQQQPKSAKGQQASPAPPSPPPPPPPPRRRRRTKRVVVPVLKKKYRKCVTRSKVKRCIVDRIAEEHWENVNGNYDKDGEWHDFGQMTSTYVLTGGANASTYKAEENVLHILPYVNYTW